MAIDPNLVYVNGIDPETGTYAFPPRSVDDLARRVRDDPAVGPYSRLFGTALEISFKAPFGVELEDIKEAGWGIIFPEDTSQDVHSALTPLLEARRQQTRFFTELDYKKGERIRGWYQRHHISPGNLDRELVPYYLLLVGSPNSIPFEFQYLLGVEYAVGRLAFEAAPDYERYTRSILDYEKASSVPNTKQIAYWGTRHPADPATKLSASFLIEPLANGIPNAPGKFRRPIHADVGYDRSLRLGDDATKASLCELFQTARPPAMIFTASHGLAISAGRPAKIGLVSAPSALSIALQRPISQTTQTSMVWLPSASPALAPARLIEINSQWSFRKQVISRRWRRSRSSPRCHSTCLPILTAVRSLSSVTLIGLGAFLSRRPTQRARRSDRFATASDTS
jgi:hypothetical protein